MSVDTFQNNLHSDTLCYEPGAPLSSLGSDSGNMIVNGDFSAPTTAPWIIYSSVNANPPIAEYEVVDNGVFQFQNNGTVMGDSSPSVVLEQYSLGNSGGQNPLELRLQLSPTLGPKRVTVILRDSWYELRYCSFYVDNALVLTVVYMTTYPRSSTWSAMTLSIYDSTPSANNSFIRVDNVSLCVRPSIIPYMQQPTTADTICTQYNIGHFYLLEGMGEPYRIEAALASATMIGEAVREYLTPFSTLDLNDPAHIDPRAAFNQVLGTSSGNYIKFETSVSGTNNACIIVIIPGATIRTIRCHSQLNGPAPNTLPYTEFVTTYMLGFLFSEYADRISGDYSLAHFINNTRNTTNQIEDEDGSVVMGNISICNNAWLRGERGWGSGPGSTYATVNTETSNCNPSTKIFTNFQQNPMPYVNNTDANQSTGSDMFLNWVYSTVGRGGFSNRSWNPVNSCNTTVGCSDASNPGRQRLIWMNGIMGRMFTANGW
ncbi:MAG: hypothetical protein SGI73_23090 [Chloroflexota bacterium]|nr:hypothetical protein [Chloroflexota bacterium]